MNLHRAALAGVLMLSCSTQERAPDEKAALGGEVAARVGGQAIPLSLIASVARAQRVPPQDAARKVIDDEIAANAARSRGLDTRQPAGWNLVTTRARLVTDRVREEAHRMGPPTNEEVELLSARHWAEVDRPVTYRVVHAIAMRPKKPQNEALAKEIAQKLHEAAAGATSVADFEARTKAVPHPKTIDVRVEQLPAFTSDGRVMGGGGMDAKFSASAAVLAVGATSNVVESSFGWHVIRSVEQLPEMRMPFEDRRVAFAEEVYAMRGHNAVTALLKELLARHSVEVSPAAESLMRSVPIGNEQQASTP